jgi:Tfp pilus assembly protein FimV
MSRKTLFFIAGIVTTIVMVLVLGVVSTAGRLNQPVAATSTADPAATPAAGQVCANPSDVANLQAQVQAYQTALQQANDQLQAAYQEIAALQSQGGFQRGGDDNGGFFNPFGDN